MPKAYARKTITDEHGTYTAEYSPWRDPRTKTTSWEWVEVDEEAYPWLRRAPEWCNAIRYWVDGMGADAEFECVLNRLECAGYDVPELVSGLDQNPFAWALIEAATRGEFHDDYVAELGASGGYWPESPRHFLI